MLSTRGRGPAHGRKPLCLLPSTAKPRESPGWWYQGTMQREAMQWFMCSVAEGYSEMFWSSTTLAGAEISGSCADLNLFSSKEVLLVQKEHSSSVMSAPSLLFLPPLSFLSHSLLFALVHSTVSRTVSLLSLVFFIMFFQLSPVPFLLLPHSSQGPEGWPLGAFHTL